MPKCKVLRIKQKPGGYDVIFEDEFTGKGKTGAFAPKVLLAGGVLGSTEILLRSKRENTLPLARRSALSSRPMVISGLLPTRPPNQIRPFSLATPLVGQSILRTSA